MKEILPNIFAEKLNVKDNRWKIVYGKLYIYQREQLSDINVREIELPPGSYEILFTTKDCTEEQAATLPMEDSGINFGYKDYEGKQSSHFYADHALLSLLRSHSLDPKNKNYLLLKKIS